MHALCAENKGQIDENCFTAPISAMANELRVAEDSSLTYRFYVCDSARFWLASSRSSSRALVDARCRQVGQKYVKLNVNVNAGEDVAATLSDIIAQEDIPVNLQDSMLAVTSSLLQEEERHNNPFAKPAGERDVRTPSVCVAPLRDR